MKKAKKIKISLVIVTSFFTLSLTAIAGLSAYALMAGSQNNYSCSLPEGYSEIKEAIDVASRLNASRGSETTSMKIRGTVTRVCGNSAYIQRVNQQTNEIDAIQLYNISNHDDITEGSVIDLDGGTIINYYGVPEWNLASYSISYDQNPYGFGPKEFYSLNSFNENAFKNQMNDQMYSINRLVKVHGVRVENEITADDVSLDYYSIRGATFTDGIDGTNVSINTGNATDTNNIKLLLNQYHESNTTLDVTGILGYEGNARVFKIVSANDIELHTQDIACESVKVSPSTLRLKIGDSSTLSVETNPVGLTVSYSSSNPEIASVNDRGTVTALASGEATITASCLDKSDTCKVFVNKSGSVSTELTFLAINDFHGAIISQSNHAGIVSVAGIMRSYDQDNTLLINSGDMFQGSIESNYNYGELLSKIIDKLDFSASILGNHEFDWGDTYIKRNAVHQGRAFLGANIYKYDISTKTTLDYASDIAAKYNIVVKNGVKVGLIGTIGSDQITSICSQFVDGYSFENPIPIIKTLSDELRTEHGCDVVVLSHHGSQDELLGQGITSISPVSSSRYIDAAFCAHTHVDESATENGVSFIQTSGYGTKIGKTVLTVTEGQTTTKEYRYNLSSFGGYDAEIDTLVNEYKTISDVAGKEVLTSITDTYRLSQAQISNLYNQAVYEAAKRVDPTIVLALGNNARTTLKTDGTDSNGYYKVTYATLYESLPFDNQIIIGDVKGSDIIKEAKFDSIYIYRFDSTGVYPTLDSNTYYRIAVLDYVGTHRNASRNYNYFPSLVQTDIMDDTNYRNITAEFLRGKTHITSTDFDSNLSFFNKTTLY